MATITATHTCWDADRVGFLCLACQAAREAAQEAAQLPLALHQQFLLERDAAAALRFAR